MGEVIIMRACSGAGKSTYVEKNWPEAKKAWPGDVGLWISREDVRCGLRNYPEIIVSADYYHTDRETGKYNWKPENIDKAHGSCLQNFVTAIVAGVKTIIVDNTNTQLAEVAPYAALAKAYGYKVRIVNLWVHPALAHSRNRHAVPLETVQRQFHRMWAEGYTFPKWWPQENLGSYDEALDNG